MGAGSSTNRRAAVLALCAAAACGLELTDRYQPSTTPLVPTAPRVFARAARGVVSSTGGYRQETIAISASVAGTARVALGNDCAAGQVLADNLRIDAVQTTELTIRAEGPLAAEGIYPVQVCFRSDGDVAAHASLVLRVDNRAPTVTTNVAAGAHCGPQVVRFHCDDCAAIAYATSGAVAFAVDGSVASGKRHNDADPLLLRSSAELAYAAIDLAGNVSPIARTAVTITAGAAPALSVRSISPAVVDPRAQIVPTKSTLLFTAAARLPFSVRLGRGSCTKGKLIAQGTTGAGPDHSVEIPIASLGEGDNQLAVCVQSTEGCLGTAPFQIHVVPPPAPPTPPPTPRHLAIATLSSTNCGVIDHNDVTSDDRGGIAITANRVFVGGDGQTASYDLSLATGAGLGMILDTIFSDLGDERAYVFAAGSPPQPVATGRADSLLALDDGGNLSTAIPLGQAITLGSGGAIHATIGGALIVAGGRVYRVETPSGAVEDLGPAPSLSRYGCEGPYTHGVAELIDGAWWLAYRTNAAAAIVRTRVSDGQTETIAAFADLSDLCSFTVSPRLNRWYFHHENSSQFGVGSELLGSCEASFR